MPNSRFAKIQQLIIMGFTATLLTAHGASAAVTAANTQAVIAGPAPTPNPATLGLLAAAIGLVLFDRMRQIRKAKSKSE